MIGVFKHQYRGNTPALTATKRQKKQKSNHKPPRNKSYLILKKNTSTYPSSNMHRYVVTWSTEKKKHNIQALNTHHLNWFFVKISFSHQLFLVSDIKAFLCQGLYNSIMTQKWFCSITLENKASSTTVEFCRQQQVHNRWFNVLLVVLVSVKRFSQFFWNIFYKDKKPPISRYQKRQIQYQDFSYV